VGIVPEDGELTLAVTGVGDNEFLGVHSENWAYELELELNPSDALIGDYNGDGKVSAADYTVWRDHVGASSLDNRDPDNSEPVGDDDFNSWKAHYGGSFGQGSGANSFAAAVPEPGSLALAGCMLLAAVVVAARRRMP